jgi:crotonobetainyl-CoA:carnitine CoA-transferase CaiB-like acyl-CoA transferase
MSYAGPRAGRLTPRIGEHNDEIYFGELLLSKDELDALRREGII